MVAATAGYLCESFEPVAARYQQLQRQVAINAIEERDTTHQSAVGADACHLHFSTERAL